MQILRNGLLALSVIAAVVEVHAQSPKQSLPTDWDKLSVKEFWQVKNLSEEKLDRVREPALKLA